MKTEPPDAKRSDSQSEPAHLGGLLSVPPVPGVAAEPETDRSLRQGLWYCVKVFFGVRVAMSVLALVAAGLLPHIPVGGATLADGTAIPGPVGVPGWPAHAIVTGWGNLFTGFERFDALWYLRIASHGYAPHDGSAAFFPLFPVVTRWVSWLLGGHPFGAAMVVANAAFLGALMMLYVLGRDALSEFSSRISVLFVAVFPTSFFLGSPYSESLFLLLVLVSVWGARRRRWPVAGVAGALAALDRNVGLLLVLPLAVEAVLQWREDRQEGGGHPGPASLGSALAWAAVPALGTATYFWYWQQKAGDWLAPLHQQAGWQRHLVSPVGTVVRGSKLAFQFTGLYPGGYHELDWVIAVPVLALAAYAAVRFRPTYGVYTWASILVPLAYVFDGRPLMSFPRFALPLFPVAWGFALLTEHRPAARHVGLAVSAVLLGFLLILYVNWLYVF